MYRYFAILVAATGLTSCDGSDTDGPCHNVDCSSHGECVVEGSSFRCECDEGYVADGPQCEEITADGDADVDSDSDGDGDPCELGYQWDGGECVDIDECEDDTHDCDENADCTNTDGAYSCECTDGFEGDGTECVDIDECDGELLDCDENADCTNTDGGYACECTDGYEGDGTECTDIDECGDDTHDCDDNAECTNTEGGYSCECMDGFEGDGTECVDIDECDGELHDCHENADCTNTDGGYTCECSDGYEGDGAECTDIDECLTETHDCDENADCTNTDGGYTCGCIDGYEGDGTECTDIDECLAETDDCDENADCTNTDGAYTCECRDGYEGDGTECTDIDECLADTDDCDENADCTNTDGAYTCECLPGFIDEAGDGTLCTCPAGLTACGGACVDTDTDTDHCGACAAVCSPARATAICDAGSCLIESCDEGYTDCDEDDTTGCELHGLCSWAVGFGGVGSDNSFDVAVDESGNIYITGSFRGTTNLGGDDLTAHGFADLFIASYSSAGVHRWSQRYGGYQGDGGYGIAVDGSGNIYVTGTFSGATDFGGGALRAEGSRNEFFVASFTSGGDHRWSLDSGDATIEQGQAVAVDESGNVYVTGYFEGTMDFGEDTLTTLGDRDIFLASFTSDGDYRWSASYGGTHPDEVYGVAADGDGNVYLAGMFRATVDFGGGAETSAGQGDIFVASYSTTGTHRWSHRFGGADNDRGYAVAVFGDDTIYLTGFTNGAVDFGSGEAIGRPSYNGVLVNFTSDGVHRWSRAYNQSGGVSARDVAVDELGNVYFTGYMGAPVNFGGGYLRPAGRRDVYVASLSSAGEYRWSRLFGGEAMEVSYGISVDGSGNVIVVGTFDGTADFGDETLENAGSTDIFLLGLFE